MSAQGQITSVGWVADEPTAQPGRAPGMARSSHKPLRTVNSIGRHLVLLGLTPAFIFGIAVGATTVVLNLADNASHLAGIAIIWGAATIVSILAIVAGTRESATLSRQIILSEVSGTTRSPPSTSETPNSGEWPDPPMRYQSLKSINPER